MKRRVLLMVDLMNLYQRLGEEEKKKRREQKKIYNFIRHSL
jgi:hypothetical protein